MRIAIDIKAFKNGNTGIARYLRSIMDQLQQIDRENNYYLFECTTSDYQTSNPRWKKIMLPWRFPGIFWQQIILPNHLKKYKIDILWAPEQICPIFGMRNIGIVTTVHDFTFLRYPKTSQWSNRWIQALLFPSVATRSKVLAPVSEFVGREVSSVYATRLKNTSIECVSNGSPEWSVPSDYSASHRDDFLFFVGNLEPRKNLVRLIQSLELLREKEGVKVPLHIAGPAGWKNRSLLSLIEHSPIKDGITYLGFISEEELKRKYLTAKACIYPSIYEGFGLPVLEALALDCLVLTSHNTVMKEIAGDSALYFDPEKTENIAEVIKQIINPAFDRNTILKNRANVIARYSWKNSAEKMLDIFKKLSSPSF
jgi:glycosyltransferase involved in cell wall biosynthesis